MLGVVGGHLNDHVETVCLRLRRKQSPKRERGR